MQQWSHAIPTTTGSTRMFTTREEWRAIPVAPGAYPQQEHFRVCTDTQTGEVVRTWCSPPGGSLPPYDFTAMEAELRQRFGPPMHGFAAVPHIPTVGEVDPGGWCCTMIENDPYRGNSPPITTWQRRHEASMTLRVQRRQAGTVLREDIIDERIPPLTTWSSNTGYVSGNMNVTYNTMQVSAPFVVPDEASYIESCLYGGCCAHCEEDIEPGDPIWWRGAQGKKRSRIWCGRHKPRPAPAGTDHDEEQDMAQRQDFTFPYTGQEIADSLERKAAALDAQQVGKVVIDRDTAALLGYSTDDEYEELVKSKQRVADRKNEQLAKDAAALRKEAIPYAKSGKKSFDIDLEDIEHFGLNDEDAPARARKPRVRREKAPEAEPVAG